MPFASTNRLAVIPDDVDTTENAMTLQIKVYSDYV